MLAERLGAHPAVETVRYPGSRFSSRSTSTTVRRRPRRARGADDRECDELGGARSKLEARHRWEGDRIPEGLLRLSVGLEEAEELWDDLESALDQGMRDHALK